MSGVRPNAKYVVHDKPYKIRLTDRIKETEMSIQAEDKIINEFWADILDRKSGAESIERLLTGEADFVTVKIKTDNLSECIRRVILKARNRLELQNKLDAVRKDRDSWEKLWRQLADTNTKLTKAFHEMTDRAARAERELLEAKNTGVRFASITPRYPGDNTKRAPIDGDTHNCGDEVQSSMCYFGRDWHYGDGENYPIFPHCPHCGGLLPTQDKHEGNASENKPFRFGGDYWKLTNELWEDATAAPQDIAARKQREDAEIERAWKIAAAYYISPEKEISDFLREYANRCIKVSCSMQANSNRWSIYFQQNSYPRDIVGAVIGEGHPGITRFSYERTGAELLSLLFPAPIMGSKEAPSAWVAVEDGLPKDSETVLVKLAKDDEPQEPTLGYYRNSPRIGIVWTYQKLGGEVKLDRHEGAVVNKVTHWRRIE